MHHFLSYAPALAWLKSVDGDVAGPLKDTWAHNRLIAGAQGLSRTTWVPVGATRKEVYAAALGAINALAAETNVEELFERSEIHNRQLPCVPSNSTPTKRMR